MERVLYLTARTLLKSPADCADAMQEATLSAWTTLHRLRDEARLEGYVLQILRHRCYQMLRAQREIPVDQLPEAAEVVPDSALSEALDGLSPEARQLLLWHHDAGYTLREIARVVRLPEGVVKARLFRARKKLASLLAEAEETPTPARGREKKPSKGGAHVE